MIVKIALYATLSLISSVGWGMSLSGTAAIFDGDTIEINDQVIRLEGIDAPETAQLCKTKNGKRWRCGKEVMDYLRGLLAGQNVRCEGDQKDAYQRLLATCYIGNENLNKLLVIEGWAVAFRKYSNTYVIEEETAKAAKVGIWQGEFQRPAEFRRVQWGKASASAPNPECPIKGNINRKGLKIYHTPYSKSYKKTKINVDKGERWFCSEAEALAAGWRAPRN